LLNMSHQAPLAMWFIFFEKLLDVALSAPFLPSLPVPVSIYFCVYHLEHYSLYHFCYHRMEVIDKCFSHDTVEEIVDALESEAARLDEEWCTLALKRLKEASPLALKVSLRSIREGRYQTLDECLVREYRMSMNAISKQFSHEFCEGVRARLVEKDLAPKWDPPALEYVTKDMVDAYFAPLGEFDAELKLPTETREAFV